MPYVSVKCLGPLSDDQKSRIVKGITTVLEDVAGKNPASTNISIEEFTPNNWGKNGELVQETREREASA